MNFYIEGAQAHPDGPISSLPSHARLRHGRKVSGDDQDRGELKKRSSDETLKILQDADMEVVKQMVRYMYTAKVTKGKILLLIL